MVESKMTHWDHFVKWVGAQQMVAGVLAVVASSFFFTAGSFIAKVIFTNNYSNPPFIAFTRMFLMLFFITPVCSAHKVNQFSVPILKSNWKILTLRCINGTVGLLLMYTALSHLELAEAGVVFHSFAPIFSSIFACVFLKDKFKYWDILLFLMTFSGVVLILRPPVLFGSDTTDRPFEERLLGLSCAMLGSLCQAIAILCMRLLAKVDCSFIVWWLSVFGTLILSVCLLVTRNDGLPVCYLQRFGAVLCGVFSTCGQLLMTYASRHIPTPVVALVRSAEVALLFLSQAVILRIMPHGFSLIGSMVIIFAMALLISRAFVIDQLKKQSERTDTSFFGPSGQYHSLLVFITK